MAATVGISWFEEPQRLLADLTVLPGVPNSGIAQIAFPAIPPQNAQLALSLQYQLESSQWFDADRLGRLQREQLRRLLRHAWTAVPYQRQRLEEHGCRDPNDLDNVELSALPIMSRRDIQAAGDTLYSTADLPQFGATRFTETSGSTGVPVRIKVAALNDLFWRAYALRDHTWHRRDLTGTLAAIRWAPKAQARPPEGVRRNGWGPVTDIVFGSGEARMLNVDTSVTEQIDWLHRCAPHYLLSFPSNLNALAAHCIDTGIDLPGLREVRTIGENLTPASRALYRRAWGVPTSDVYTCEEAGYLALQCPDNPHYHVMAEGVMLEIVDDDGNPCPPGQPGRVLVTALHNFHTPLIRYELGDIAQFGAACSCGRRLPVLSSILGRKRNRLMLPDGDSRFAFLGEHGQIQAACGAKPREFQFVQTALDELEIKLVIDPLNREQEAAVAAVARSNLGGHFHVRFSYHDRIERGPTGKFEEFVSLVDQ